MNCYCPMLGTIEILAEEGSLSNLQSTHVTDFSGTYLIPRSFFLGRILSIIRGPFEYWGAITRDGGLRLVLETARVALDQFKKYLLNPVENPDAFVETFLSVSYNNVWPPRFKKVYQLFYPGESFPSMDRALCLLAPKVLRAVTASPIPLEELETLLLNKNVSPFGRKALNQWIEDVNFFGDIISQKLLFSFLKSIVQHRFPDYSSHQTVASAFYLAWCVHQIGLKALVDDHPPLIQPERDFLVEREGQEPLCVGDKLSFVTPMDFPVDAYAVPRRPELMILRSDSFLTLGVWAYSTMKKFTRVQFPRIEFMSEGGDFFVTERIEGCLSSPDIWEKGGIASKRNSMLCCALARTVHDLCGFAETSDISMDHLVLTRSGEIRSLKAVEKNSDYLDIRWIELFIREACHADEERMRFVHHKSDMHSHPLCVTLRRVITQHCFQATEAHIREMMGEMLSENGLRSVIEWHGLLQNRVRFAQAAIGKLPAFSSRASDHLKLLAEAFCALQVEIGFEMQYPQDISSRLAAWVESNAGSGEKVTNSGFCATH